MSTTIDERIVEMRFDNQQFEAGAQTTMRTLDKLKNSLNIEESARGLESALSSFKSFSLNGLASGVEAVQVKFSALETMATTCLVNITNSAYRAGESLVKSLTIEPIKTGFQEYETQIKAVQTILANTQSKGSTLEDVNVALDELNEYADQTIYNFTEMTRNIGTFTAAGVELDSAVSAIQGIANLAAVSGSTSQQASTAMYQLSQALASGRVSLQDWNSVVNAGMGGELFQNALKRTAKAMGIAVDESESFRNSISTTGGKESWLTSDVLLETLKQFTLENNEANKSMLVSQGYTEAQAKEILTLADTATEAATKVKTFSQLFEVLKESAQSGWTQSWETIVGDFEEAKKLLTDISEIFTGILEKSADKRNNLLTGWADIGGRDALIESMYNVMDAVSAIVEPISQAFRDIFPETTVSELFAMTKNFQKFTLSLIISDEQADRLKRTFKGLFAILDIGKQLLEAVWKQVQPLIGGLKNLANSALEITANWGDWLVELSNTIREGNVFKTQLDGMVDGLKKFSEVALGFVDLNDIMVSFYEGGGGVAGVFEVLFDRIVYLVQAFTGLAESMTGLDFSEFESNLVNNIQNVRDKVVTFLSGIGLDSEKMRSTVLAAFTEMGLFLTNCKFIQALESLWNFTSNVASKIGEVIGNLSGGLIDSLKAVDLSKVVDIAGGASLATIGAMIAKFIGELAAGIHGVLRNVSGILNEVKGCFESYQNDLNANALLKIAGAIAVLTASIFVLSTLNGEQLRNSLAAITAMFVELMAVMGIVDGTGGDLKGMAVFQKAISSMISMAVAIGIMSLALRSIATLEPEQITLGLMSITGMMAMLVFAAEKLSTDVPAIMKGASSLVVFGVAVKILASACENLAALNWQQLAIGLVGVGVLMAELSLFMKKTDFNGLSVSSIVGIVALAAAVNIIADAVAELGQMNPLQLIAGVMAVGGLLAEIGAIMHLMPNDILGTAAGLVLVGMALNLMGAAVKNMGTMGGAEMATGLTVMGIALTELALALNFMKGTLPGSAALLVAATALSVFVPVLYLLGSMSWESIIKSMVALAATFTILGVAGAVLAPLAPVLLSLAGAIALMGVGVAAVGVGLLAAGAGIAALAVGLGSLATMGAAGATALVAALSTIIIGVAKLIPTVAIELGKGIVEFAKVIIDGAPVIAEAFITIIAEAARAVGDSLPLIVTTIVELLVSVLETLVEYTPQIVEAGYKILTAVLEKIAANISMVIQTAIDIVLGFIDGISQKLPAVVQAGFDLLISFINGITDAINNNTPALVEAIKGLIHSLINAAIEVLTGGVTLFIEAGGNIISGLIKGIGDGIGAVIDAAKNIAKSILNTITGEMDINSPSKEMEKIGKYSDEGLVQGLLGYMSNVENAAADVGHGALDSMADAISGMSDIVNGDIDYEPTIRPILDLSNVQSGAGMLNTMLNQRHVASVASSYNASKLSVTPETSDDIIGRLSTRFGEQMLEAIAKSPTPVNVTVSLEGDAGKVFKLVRTENDKFAKTTGHSAFA